MKMGAFIIPKEQEKSTMIHQEIALIFFRFYDNRRIFARVLLSLGLLGAMHLFQGCSTPIQYVHFPDQSKTIETPGKARVYVVFPHAIKMIKGRTFPVCENERKIGENAPNGYLCWETDPGKKLISTKRPELLSPTDSIELTFEANRVYFIKQKINPFDLVHQLSLSLLTEQEGKDILNKCCSPEN